MAASKFKVRTKRIPLGFIGDAWRDADAYLETRFITIPDSRRIQEMIAAIGDSNSRAIEESINVVKNQFISGKTVDADGQLVDLSVEDLEVAFDADAILAIYTRVLGNPDPKVSATSTTTTPVEDQNQPSD